jgi:DNA-binding transcriptional regulator YiaG
MTPKTIKTILRHIAAEDGIKISAARRKLAEACGVGYRTVQNWEMPSSGKSPNVSAQTIIRERWGEIIK